MINPKAGTIDRVLTEFVASGSSYTSIAALSDKKLADCLKYLGYNGDNEEFRDNVQSRAADLAAELRWDSSIWV